MTIVSEKYHTQGDRHFTFTTYKDGEIWKIHSQDDAGLSQWHDFKSMQETNDFIRGAISYISGGYKHIPLRILHGMLMDDKMHGHYTDQETEDALIKELCMTTEE